MIIREEWDKLRIDGPRIFRCPFYRPIGLNEDIDLSKPLYDVIYFSPEPNQDAYSPDVYIKVWDVPWRWYCQTCYMSCGDRRHVFSTDWVKREDLGGKGNRNLGGFSEPTRTQQDQMADHAQQHSIMFAWAKGLK